MVATLVFNGFATGTRFKPVLLPLRCRWAIFGGWNISAREQSIELEETEPLH